MANKCKACGQFSGRGHRCPALMAPAQPPRIAQPPASRTPVKALPTRETARKTAPTANMTNRVARARVNLTTSPSTPKTRPTLTDMSWADARAVARTTDSTADLSALVQHPHWIVRNEVAGRALTTAEDRKHLAHNDENLAVQATARNAMRGLYETDVNLMREKYEHAGRRFDIPALVSA